jgi:alkanesulfonate monooxygenase SsuD/methylene tetrahydromethanopterin reductase-like flavin-dependent oxidoreductase (luciferase family)
MEFGVIFPTTEIGNDPVAIRDYAQAAEELGYSYLVAFDHVLGAVHEGREPKLWGPYTEAHPFHEPFVLFGFLAGVTSRLEFETSVIILPQRQTALVAKQAAEIAVLSGKRFDEQIDVLRQLWAKPVVDVDGKFHSIPRAGIAPRPAATIPIWFGGFSDIALRRAARVGDGFTFPSAGKRTAEQVERLRGYLTEQGRDPSTYPVEFSTAYGIGPERWQRAVQLAKETGVTHFGVNTMSSTSDWAGTAPAGLNSPAEHIKAIETFINSVR